MHYEAAAESRDPTATTMMQIEDACKSVGEVIVEFTEGYNAKHMGVEGFVPLLPRLLCAVRVEGGGGRGEGEGGGRGSRVGGRGSSFMYV